MNLGKTRDVSLWFCGGLITPLQGFKDRYWCFSYRGNYKSEGTLGPMAQNA